MAVPIKKGVEFDCDMFNVRCKQPCVSGGVRHTDKCPYDNYRGADAMGNPKIPTGYQGHYAKNNGGGDTLIMVTKHTELSGKGAKTMADNKKGAGRGGNNAPASGGGGFTPTFRKYADMSDTEKAAFRQGAKTSENKVKERLGFTRPKN